LLAELVGGDDELRLALRPRLRADWIERTPAICFPYRSLLGLLALTAGAWDRLALSLMGSLPSLVLTAVQAARNATDFKQASQRLRAGLTERVERLLRDEFRGAIRQFRAAVIASLPRETLTESVTSESSSWGATASGEMDEVRILGLDGAEADSRRIMQEVVRERRAATSTVLLFAGLATLSFVFLLTGPLVALYRAYLGAHHNAFLAAGTKWTDFPAPTASMLLASLVLSVLPVFALALVALTWCCRAARIRAAADDIQQQHRQALQQRFESGALRIELTDQQLDAARLLLAMTTRSS
jgi:hypothetical protein